MDFVVKQQGFEGPLEKLLELIEGRKLHINDLSLSAVTDEYLSWSKDLPERTIGDTAQFILIASTLLLIKSKSLLPSLTLSEEEESDVVELQARLIAYKRMKLLAATLKPRFGASFIFLEGKRERQPVFSPDASVTINGIFSSIKTVIAGIPVKEFLPETVVRKIISLEEMIVRLSERVTRSISISFKDFTKGVKERKEVIIGFLAVLELVKRGALAVTQDSEFSEIRIESRSPQTPSYS
ncbi:MAG: ScpA family protein [Patescibacteria group bacterium]